MCQLFAMNSQHPVAVNQALSPFMARGGRTGDHADGWGVAFHDGAHSRVFIEHRRACDSALAAFLCLYPIQATTVIAHVRKATHGKVGLSNCHPFQREWQGRTWSFSHNGKLLDYAPTLTGPYRPVGDTDSELAFCALLQGLRAQLPAHDTAPPHWQAVAPRLATLATEVARHGEFNFTLTDGHALYALCTSRLSWRQQLGRRGAAQVHLATEPVDADPRWQPFARGELKVFVQGQPVGSHVVALPAPHSPPEPVALAA